MKFAFSTVSCPKWDFETILARAREWGYHGVEIRGAVNESTLTAANVFLTDLGKLRRAFEGGGVEIACLASPVAMTGKRKEDARQAEEARRFIDTAEALGCRLVKVFDTQARPGLDRASAG